MNFQKQIEEGMDSLMKSELKKARLFRYLIFTQVLLLISNIANLVFILIRR